MTHLLVSGVVFHMQLVTPNDGGVCAGWSLCVCVRSRAKSLPGEQLDPCHYVVYVYTRQSTLDVTGKYCLDFKYVYLLRNDHLSSEIIFPCK